MTTHITFSKGYELKKCKEKKALELIIDAKNKAMDADVALVFVGLTDEYETEGADRHHLSIPPMHITLIEEVAKVNPNTVVVLSGGASIEMPWADKVPAILNMFLTGQAGGSAVCDILFGDVNPSGKLSETYPVALSDNSSYNYFPGTTVSVEHREGVYVGYKYYDTANKEVAFPFGFGLSYTTFEYSDIKVSADKIKDTDTVTVSFKVKNTGDVDGAEVAQLYVNDVESTIYRPVKELRGFKKVFLKAGEEAEVSIELDKRAFAYYNVNIGDWHVESGDFKILVGASSRDIRLEATVNVESTVEAEIPDYRKSAPCYYGADIMNVSADEFKAVYGKELPPSQRDKNAPFTVLNTIEDSKDGKWGGRLYRLLIKLLGADTLAGAVATQLPIKNFISMSFGLFSPEMAQGLILILAEDKLGKGLKIIFKGIPNLIKNLDRLKKI